MGAIIGSIGSIGNLLGNQGDGSYSLNLSGVQNLEAIQTIAHALGSANMPDAQTLQTLREGITAITENAPPEKVEDDLKDLSNEAQNNPQGFWPKFKSYLSNAIKLAQFLPLIEKYAPKALEALKTLAGNPALFG